MRRPSAASAEIEDHATAPGKTVAEKIDYAQQRIMALADTASAGKREPPARRTCWVGALTGSSSAGPALPLA